MEKLIQSCLFRTPSGWVCLLFRSFLVLIYFVLFMLFLFSPLFSPVLIFSITYAQKMCPVCVAVFPIDKPFERCPKWNVLQNFPLAQAGKVPDTRCNWLYRFVSRTMRFQSKLLPRAISVSNKCRLKGPYLNLLHGKMMCLSDAALQLRGWLIYTTYL